jgi:hypothetical protein
VTIRTVEEILKEAGKQQSPDSFASDIVIAAAILAQAIDRHTEAVNVVAKHLAERPK